ncbi:replicative DNA helicase [Kitasatospora sp. NPDC002040]|uniref:replicative DNA helicase n=1 Tax=Kitasatospora sp. NPDC002040 TaxID=3154661 RepID=UPI003320D2A3
MGVVPQDPAVPDEPVVEELVDPELDDEPDGFGPEPESDFDDSRPPAQAPRWGDRARSGPRAGSQEAPGEEFERVPPQDLAAEQSVLGGMMLSKDAIGDVIELLKPRDYYRPAHELIHSAIVDLYAKGEPADPITVAAELTKRGELARAGGPGYLHTLVNTVPTAANAEYYAQIVHERAVLRRLVEAGTRIAGMGYAAEGDIDDITQAAHSVLFDAVSERAAASTAPIGDDIEGFYDDLDNTKSGELVGLSTGLADLDALTTGLLPGQLVVIGARPAMGKSTLALDLLRCCSIQQGLPGVIFSLEMGRKEIVQRTFSAEARVALHHIKGGTITDDDLHRLARRTPDIKTAPLEIDDSPELTALEIRTRSRRLAQKYGGLGLVVVDYIQLMQSGGTKQFDNRQAEVADMSRNLKLLAKELECPVVALSQLNRGPAQRTEKVPQLSDLRESGAIEQDADIVILLHRDDAYEKESPRAGEIDLHVAKHRGGPTATITAAFQGHYSRIVDMTKDVN